MHSANIFLTVFAAIIFFSQPYYSMFDAVLALSSLGAATVRVAQTEGDIYDISASHFFPSCSIVIQRQINKHTRFSGYNLYSRINFIIPPVRSIVPAMPALLQANPATNAATISWTIRLLFISLGGIRLIKNVLHLSFWFDQNNGLTPS